MATGTNDHGKTAANMEEGQDTAIQSTDSRRQNDDRSRDRREIEERNARDGLENGRDGLRSGDGSHLVRRDGLGSEDGSQLVRRDCLRSGDGNDPEKLKVSKSNSQDYLDVVIEDEMNYALPPPEDTERIPASSRLIFGSSNVARARASPRGFAQNPDDGFEHSGHSGFVHIPMPENNIEAQRISNNYKVKCILTNVLEQNTNKCFRTTSKHQESQIIIR